MSNETESAVLPASQSDDDENLRKLLETCTEINASSSAGETSCDENSRSKNQKAESFCTTPDTLGTPQSATRTPTQKIAKGKGKQKNKELTEEEIDRMKIPLEVFGWRREVVYRTTGACDVYYYDPVDSKKLRSVPELKKFLAENEITELTVENFCFQKVALNAENEIVRPAQGRPGAPTASSSAASSTVSPSSASGKKKQAAKKPPVISSVVTAIAIEEQIDKSFESPESSRSSFLDATNVIEKLNELSASTAVDEKSIEMVSENQTRIHVLQEQSTDVNVEDQIIERMENLVADASQELAALPESSAVVESSSKKRKISSSSGLITSTSPKRRKNDSSGASTSKNKTAAVVKKSAKKQKKAKLVGSKAVKKALSRLSDSIEEDESREEDEGENKQEEEEDGEKVGQESEDNVSKMDSCHENQPAHNSTLTEAENSSVEEIRRTADDSVNEITDNNTDDSDRISDRKDVKERHLQDQGVNSECETAICDNRDTHDTICASCLLEFHLVCASKRGRLVETAKDSYFICNACYYNHVQDGRTGAKTGSNNNSNEPLIRQIVALSGKQQQRSSELGVVAAGGRTGSSWMADVCAYYQLLKMIFKHLIVVDLLKARLVCKTWNDACMTGDFWRIASLKGCQIREWSKAAAFLRERRVQILDFFGVKTSVQAFTVSLKDMDYLTGLHFGHVVPLVLYAIKDCTRVLSRLENLRFTVTEQRRPEKISEISVNFELFRHTINLKYLRVMAGKFFELKILNLNYLQTLSRLTNLTLLDVKIDDLTEWQFLRKLQNLQCLRIGSCANWNSKTYEIISNLKNLEKLRLEIGETIPHDYLSQTLVALPKLKELCLVKFSVNRVIMDLIASKKLATLMIWPDFGSKNALHTWRHLVDGLAKQKAMKNFVLGVASKDLLVARDGGPAPEQPTLEKGQVPVKFAYENALTGSLKMIWLDDFLRYAKKYVPNVYNFYFKDDSVACTRFF